MTRGGFGLILLGLAISMVAATRVLPQVAPLEEPPPAIPRGSLTDDEVASLKQEALDRINWDRENEGQGALEWDDHAAEVADVFCAQALDDNTVGHYTLEGLGPLDRWGLAAGKHYLAENTCAWSWRGSEYRWSLGKVRDLLDDFQDAMLSERPPNDGHRRTILEPTLTHVGIGFAFEGNEFRFAQEYTAQYLEIDDVPLELERDTPAHFTGKVLDPGKYRLDYVLVYYEDVPEPLTHAECEQRMTYHLPETRKVLRPLLPEGNYYASDRRQGEFTYDADTGSFSCDVDWYQGIGWYGILALMAPTNATPGTNQFSGSWVLVQVG